jgi:hypothetical protein
MYQRWVIYDEEFGVYLGSFMGLGFWSKLDAAGQPAAPTFDDPKKATDHIEYLGAKAPKTRIVEINCLDPEEATVGECVVVGLPRWMP